MARKPFFSGNYGSALGSTANAANLIARAGATQGQMFANLGGQIGGMIQQYGLNKEKQKENKATIKSSIGILQRMSKIDEANAPEYMAQIQQLENEDVPLNQRGMLADKTLKGLSITNQLQGQMLSNQGKQQALGLAKRLETSTVENAKLQNTNLGLRNDLTELAKRKGEAITPAEIRSILGRYNQEKTLLPLDTAAKKAQFGAVPGQVERKEELGKLQVEAAKRENTSADLFLQAFGGAEGKAEFDYQGAKLSRKSFEKGLEYLDAKIDYTNYLSTAKNVPVDTKKQYASLVSHAGKILDTTVEDPETGNPITFQKYMEIANDGDARYPLKGDGSGAAGVLYGNYQNAQKQIIDFGKTIQVQVDDGQDTGGSPAPTGSPMNLGNQSPEQAMQMLQERIGQIRRELPKLNAQEQQLGQPGQMTTTAFDTSPMGNINTPLAQRPQTIGDVQNSNIPQQRADLMAELQQLEAKRQELQNQFGVR